MQKGFATLEIIFLVLIISILTTVAVPQASRLVEKISLDYEQKRLYSELKYCQTLSRSDSVNDVGMSGALPAVQSTAAVMHFIGGRSYEIQRSNKPIRKRYKLSNGVTFSLNNNGNFRIQFIDENKYRINGSNISGERTIVLKPKVTRDNQTVPTIVFDSVGRIRGGQRTL